MSQNEYSSQAVDELTYEIGDDETVSEAVVNAVAAASGCRRSSAGDTAVPVLEPLYSAIDPDALDSLFGGTGRSALQTDGSIAFSFHGYDVTVHSYGLVTLAKLS